MQSGSWDGTRHDAKLTTIGKATLTVTQTVKGAKKPKQVLKKNLTVKR